MPESAQGETHVFPFRVYYEDTDAGGVVYHANYLKFAERARSELLREIGTDNSSMLETHGVIFAVKDCAVRYHAPARLDDSLEVHTQITTVGGATFSAEQRVRCAERLLADLSVRLACLNADGRPARLPAEIKSAFETWHNRH